MRAVVFVGAGGNEVVRLVERPDPEPGPEDVVVAPRFAGMNPADLHQRLGRYPAPPGAMACLLTGPVSSQVRRPPSGLSLETSFGG